MSKIYLVTDTPICQQAGHSVEFVVEEACRAGIGLVQLREKEMSTRSFIELGEKIKVITRHYNTPLIINDRIDVALAIDAEGVHIGQDDMPYALARQLLGTKKRIGLSVNNPEELELAKDLDVDYLGIATIFSTATKQDTGKALGLNTLRSMCAHSKHVTYAIGGINQTNIQQVMQTGVTGVAIVSAICGAQSPYEATRMLNQLIEIR